MLIRRAILILIFLKLNFIRIQSKETTCIINGRKSLNVVNERFLSFSIDPATILSGFNISSTSIKLAQYLSPAFLRIAGPSIEFINFSQDEKAISFPESPYFTVTPLMWKSLNYWIKNANLTPVFAISDKNRTKGAWNPKSALPLLEMSGKMNFSCYWQLGYECKDRSIVRYKEDLSTLKQALDGFSSNRKFWKVVGSNLQPCFSNKSPELIRKTMEYLTDVTDAVIWAEKLTKSPTHFAKSPIPIWLVIPKATQPITFSSGLLWAKQIGEAAKGYEVIFRQPGLQELFTDTPVYWISLIYKTLMGRNVLEVRSNSLPHSNTNIYAHCTKKQDNYSKQGAMTIFVINNNRFEHTTSLRIAASHPKSIEVQSYTITSDGEESANTYLNGEKLTMNNLEDGQFEIFPKLRRVRVNNFLNLVSPAKSVGFFVLPGARIPVCIRQEDEVTRLLLEELEQAEDTNFSSAYFEEEFDEELRAQIPEEYQKNPGFDGWYKLMHQELKEDGKEMPQKKSNELKKQIPHLRRQKSNVISNQETEKEFRQYLKNKTKEKKENDGKTAKLEIIFTERPSKDKTLPNDIKTVELELTNEEIKKILKDRAKSKVAEKFIDITSHELENVLEQAAKNFIKNKNDTDAAMKPIKRNVLSKVLRRATDKARNEIKNRQRTKRDINMELLNRKTATEKLKPSKSISVNNQQIEATIRKFGETSEELLKSIEKSSEEKRDDIFAELATSLENYAASSRIDNEEIFGRNAQHFGTKGAHLLDLLEAPKSTPREKPCPQAKYLDERIEFLMEPSGANSFLAEDLRNYHTFQENLRFQKMVNPRPQFNNEIPEVDKLKQGHDGRMEDLPSFNTVSPQVKVEVGEWDTLPRGNYAQTKKLPSSELVRSGTNSEKWEIDTFSGRNDGKTQELSFSEMVRPRINSEKWGMDTFSGGNGKKIKDPLLSEMVRPQINSEKWEIDRFPVGNDGKVTGPPLSEMVRPRTNNKKSEMDTFPGRNDGKTQEPPFSEMVRPRINSEKWKIDTFSGRNDGKTQDSSLSEMIRPRINDERWELDKFSGGNDGKTQGSSLSEMVRPRINDEKWELDTFSGRNDGKTRNPPISEMVRPQINREVRKRDAFSQKTYGNTANLPSLEAVPPRTKNEAWEFNTFSQRNDGNTEHLSPSETLTPPFNVEVWKMDGFSKANNEKMESPSSSEMVRPQINNEGWEMDKFSHTSDGKKENLPSQMVTSRSNMKMWEINEKIGNLALSEVARSRKIWETNSFSRHNEGKTGDAHLSNFGKPQPIIEVGKWDMLTGGDDSSLPEMMKSANDDEMMEMDAFFPKTNANMESLSSSEMKERDSSFTIIDKARKTRETERNSKNKPSIVTVTTQSNNKMWKIDKSSQDLSEITPSSRMDKVLGHEAFDFPEDYFCDPKNTFPLKTEDGNQYKIRRKRDESNITKDDIKNYKKCMAEQLRVMRKARNSKLQTEQSPGLPSKNLKAKGKLKLLEPSSADLEEENLSSEGQHLHVVIGKPYDPEKLHINERRKAKQMKMLQQRLQNRKNMNEKIRERERERERKVQEIEDVDNGLETSRRKRTPYNVNTNEVHEPERHNSNTIEKYYKRRIFGPKTWKPQDIFKVKKVPSYSVENVEKWEFSQRTAPFIKNKLKETNRRKRSLNDGINSAENIIDDYPFVKIQEFTKFLKDAENEKSKRHYNDEITTETNLQEKISTQVWAETIATDRNEVNPVKSAKTSEIASNDSFEATTTSRTRPDGVTLAKNENVRDISYEHTQKPEEKEKEDFVDTTMSGSIIQPKFIDMIMDAVNSTVSSFVHLSEKITQSFSF